MGKLNLTSGSNCYVATATRGSDRGGHVTRMHFNSVVERTNT